MLARPGSRPRSRHAVRGPAWYGKFQPLGYYAMMCNTAADMHAIDAQVPAHALQFFLDHPYEVPPEPYANRNSSGVPHLLREHTLSVVVVGGSGR